MKFTICTPTFNRSHTLTRVYKSLCSQIFTDFEWVIVDDGSTDDTETLVKRLRNRKKFPIVYKKQKHQGKHIAVNLGVAVARGEFVCIADSDDAFTADALSLLNEAWMSIPEADKENYCGVTGLCVDRSANILGDKFPSDVFDSTPAECFYRHRLKGDKAGFLRTTVLREYPFPELKGFSFYLEGIIWNSIGRKYKTRYINKAIRTVFFDAGNQLTKANPKKRSQTCVFYATLLNDDIDYLTVAPWIMFKIAAQGVRFSCHQRDNLMLQFSRLSKLRAKFIWFAALPVGFTLFIVDCRQT